MPVTYENDLLLCATALRHDSLAREAMVTYAVDVGTSTGTAQDFAEGLQTIFADNWKTVLDTNVAVMRTTTLLGNGTDVFTTGESTSAPVFGTDNVATPPPNIACVIKKITGLGGRRNRGRVYMPWCLTEGDLDELGNIAGGKVTTLQEHADSWRTDIEDIDGVAGLAVAQRFYDRAWNIPGRVLQSVELSSVVIGLVVEPVCGTQRRRMPRS